MHKPSRKEAIDFVYQGNNAQGNLIKGEMSCESMPLAKAYLRKQGITLTSIKKKPKPIRLIKQKVRPLDIAIFARQLATMIQAGIPLVQALEIVGQTLENPAMTILIKTLKDKVSSGTPFAEALREHPKQFDTLFCALVDAGEHSGALETMLERVATYKEKNEQLKSKIKKAMHYPIAVITVALAVSFILLVKVVPIFADLFASVGANLPTFTQAVMTLSQWLQKFWLLLAIGLTLLISLSIYTNKHHQKSQQFWDRLILKLPLVGKLTHQAIVARFARTLSTTFAAGVPLVDALDLASGAANNYLFEHATQQIKQDVLSGQQLHISLRENAIFPTLLVQMVSVGEESGRLDDMLDKTADYYENKVDDAVEGLTSLMEPFIIVILGVIVGSLVIAMYLPIFKMGAIIG